MNGGDENSPLVLTGSYGALVPGGGGGTDGRQRVINTIDNGYYRYEEKHVITNLTGGGRRTRSRWRQHWQTVTTYYQCRRLTGWCVYALKPNGRKMRTHTNNGVITNM